MELSQIYINENKDINQKPKKKDRLNRIKTWKNIEKKVTLKIPFEINIKKIT